MEPQGVRMHMDEKVLRNLSYGMYVVTTLNEDKYAGCIANAVMQVTSTPATLLTSINKENYTNLCIKRCHKFAISILSENTDPRIIGQFGFKSSKDVDKFSGVDYSLKGNLPIINNSCGYLICEVIDQVETSTHTLFIGKVTDTGDYNEEIPMTYRYYHTQLKGTSPKNAPTYIEEKKEEKRNSDHLKRWKCKVCGYIYEGESLPNDFICPICGQPHTVFEEIK